MIIEITRRNTFELERVSNSIRSIVRNMGLLDKLVFSEPLRFAPYMAHRRGRMTEEAEKTVNDIKTAIEILNMSLYSLNLTSIEIDINKRFEMLIAKRNQYEDKLSKLSLTETKGLTLENIDLEIEKL
jgi:hypothetical protein